MVAPPWLKPWAEAWVWSGDGCQGARGDPAPGQIGRRIPTLLNLHGQGGGQGWKAVQQWGATPYNLSLQRKHLGHNLFSCPEWQEDFWSESVLDKHKNKYIIYDNILEDFADIPFKLSERIGGDLKDLDWGKYSEHNYDPKKEFDTKEEINHYSIIQK